MLLYKDAGTLVEKVYQSYNEKKSPSANQESSNSISWVQAQKERMQKWKKF